MSTWTRLTYPFMSGLVDPPLDVHRYVHRAGPAIAGCSALKILTSSSSNDDAFQFEWTAANIRRFGFA